MIASKAFASTHTVFVKTYVSSSQDPRRRKVCKPPLAFTERCEDCDTVLSVPYATRCRECSGSADTPDAIHYWEVQRHTNFVLSD